jgi:hypothetical protein
VIYHFASVPIVWKSSESRESEWDFESSREHKIDISTTERFLRPAGVGFLAFAVALFLAVCVFVGALKTGYAFATKEDELWLSFLVGASFGLLTFFRSVKEEFDFKLYMKALDDRQCGWRDLKILRDRDLELLQKEVARRATTMLQKSA